jgi:hypothetical protein
MLGTSDILDILRAYNIESEERLNPEAPPTSTEQDFPEIGEIAETSCRWERLISRTATSIRLGGKTVDHCS